MAEEFDDVFARPVMRGPRFDDHRLPVKAMRQLEKYRKLVLKLARILYEAEVNKAPPPAFNAAFELKLQTIEENCVTPVLALPRTPDALPYLPFMIESREMLDRGVEALRNGNGAQFQLPVEMLADLDAFGAGMDKNDTFEFRGPNPKKHGGIYDREVQTRIRSMREKPAYIDIGRFDGAVISFNESGQFQLRLENFGVVKCRFTPVHESKVIAALKARRFVRMRLSGQTRFAGSGVAQEVEQILELSLWSRTHMSSIHQLDGRVDELAKLEDGWLEGEGEALSVADLQWLRESLAKIMTERGVARPKLYATPTGGVQAVWRALPWRIEAEFDLSERSASLLALNVETEADEDREFELTGPDAWRELAEFIGKFIPLERERPIEKDEDL